MAYINQKSLEALEQSRNFYEAKARRLEAQNKELLALLETINEAAQGHVQINQHWLETVTRAAIAKAKGE